MFFKVGSEKLIGRGVTSSFFESMSSQLLSVEILARVDDSCAHTETSTFLADAGDSALAGTLHSTNEETNNRVAPSKLLFIANLRFCEL